MQESHAHYLQAVTVWRATNRELVRFALVQLQWGAPCTVKFNSYMRGNWGFKLNMFWSRAALSLQIVHFTKNYSRKQLETRLLYPYGWLKWATTPVLSMSIVYKSKLMAHSSILVLPGPQQGFNQKASPFSQVQSFLFFQNMCTIQTCVKILFKLSQMIQILMSWRLEAKT